MSGSLNQMTMSFSAEDDRLLFRVSTSAHSEFHLWLTRRFVRVLWPALLQLMEKDPEVKPTVEKLPPRAKSAVMAMQHQEAVHSVDMTQKHDVKKENKVMTTEPLLVTGGKVQRVGKTTRLMLHTRGGKDVTIGLDKRLLHAFCHQLSQLSHKAEWDLDLDVGDGNVVVSEGRPQVH